MVTVPATVRWLCYSPVKPGSSNTPHQRRHSSSQSLHGCCTLIRSPTVRAAGTPAGAPISTQISVATNCVVHSRVSSSASPALVGLLRVAGPWLSAASASVESEQVSQPTPCFLLLAWPLCSLPQQHQRRCHGRNLVQERPLRMERCFQSCELEHQAVGVACKTVRAQLVIACIVVWSMPAHPVLVQNQSER